MHVVEDRGQLCKQLHALSFNYASYSLGNFGFTLVFYSSISVGLSSKNMHRTGKKQKKVLTFLCDIIKGNMSINNTELLFGIFKQIVCVESFLRAGLF